MKPHGAVIDEAPLLLPSAPMDGSRGRSRNASSRATSPLPENAVVDVQKQRFPFSVVWGPLWPVTCCCPCVGHMGIADSAGRVHDFQGPYSIGRDCFMVGEVYRYAEVGAGAEEWDAAIDAADDAYREKCHCICCENCHHHTARALTESRRPHNCISAWLLCCSRGKWTSQGKCPATFLPFVATAGGAAAAVMLM